MTDITHTPYDDPPEDDDGAEAFIRKDKLKDLPVIGKWLEKRPKVAVLRLSGVIADSQRRKANLNYRTYAKLIDKAFEKAEKAVALVVNSPGGSPVQSALIAGHIRQCAQENDIPVYAFVEDVAASGGYWLACAADEIYAQGTSIVGSIGVISAGFGLERLIGKVGVERRMHTSGENKSFLDPFLPEQEKDVQRLAAIQKDMHGQFIDWVKERRGRKLRGDDAEIFDGSFWTAGPAFDYGLIDGIADIRGFARDKFGEKVKFVEIEPEKKLFALPGMPGMQIGAADVIDAVENEAVWGRYGV